VWKVLLLAKLFIHCYVIENETVQLGSSFEYIE
jgi:hypothetical protein